MHGRYGIGGSRASNRFGLDVVCLRVFSFFFFRHFFSVDIRRTLSEANTIKKRKNCSKKKTNTAWVVGIHLHRYACHARDDLLHDDCWWSKLAIFFGNRLLAEAACPSMDEVLVFPTIDLDYLRATSFEQSGERWWNALLHIWGWGFLRATGMPLQAVQ